MQHRRENCILNKKIFWKGKMIIIINFKLFLKICNFRKDAKTWSCWVSCVFSQSGRFTSPHKSFLLYVLYNLFISAWINFLLS